MIKIEVQFLSSLSIIFFVLKINSVNRIFIAFCAFFLITSKNNNYRQHDTMDLKPHNSKPWYSKFKIYAEIQRITTLIVRLI